MDFVSNFIHTQLTQNEFAQGGIVIALLSGLVMYARPWIYAILRFIKNRIVFTASFKNDDVLYYWISIWLQEKGCLNRSKRKRYVSLPSSDGGGIDSPNREIIESPDEGSHFFFWRGRPVILQKTSQDLTHFSTHFDGQNSVVEEIRLMTVFGNKGVVESIIAETKQILKDKPRNAHVYNLDPHGYWHQSSSKPSRPISSVILNNNLQYQILQDAKSFFNNKDWYIECGIPYRRGYLFYGPPGNGKTSLIKALASELSLNIYNINLSQKIEDGNLIDLFSQVKSKSIIIIEDIDCIVESRDIKNFKVTFSGLLNAIDGIGTSEDYILIMTCNNISKLDSALIRHGRIDNRIEFSNPDADTIKRLSERIAGYNLFTEDEIDDMINNQLSTSSVQYEILSRIGNNGSFKERIKTTEETETRATASV